jgi:ribosome biogenesis GTPase / thiamine phosphate phosphatase
LDLDKWGWNDFFSTHFFDYEAGGCSAGRVLSASRERYRVAVQEGEIIAELAGKLRYRAGSRGGLPAVGDWVAINRTPTGPATITGVLPRKSKFSRKVAGETVEEQVIAANIDFVLLICALNNDFNLRRLERYMTLAWESGARPVAVLTKSDLCSHVEQKIAEVRKVAVGADVLAASSVTGEGLSRLEPYLAAGSTVVLLGSSGAGKSTLLNRLAGAELQRVQEVRSGDDRGRHTTTSSEIYVLPGGALVIDTPGMRELQLWGGGGAVSETF